MIGIKGSGMSALACILHDNGYMVTGSDVTEPLFTDVCLREREITLLPFDKQNIEPDQWVIAGNAFGDDHEEVKEAKEKANQFDRYHNFLGRFIQQFTSIAITGAHGKTSTTGLMSAAFSACVPTSFLIGDGTGKGTRDTSHFVFEACEYRRHFHAYQPDYGVITNIDFDHPDYFHSLEDVKEAFETFAKGVKKGLVVCGDDVHTKGIKSSVPLHTYGIESHNNIQATAITVTEGSTTFTLQNEQQVVGQFTIPLVGTHHIQNALAVLAVALLENIPLENVQQAFDSYQGVKRRFQTILKEESVVIDDYAHHPSEINATLETARLSYPNREIVAIFQPHTFTRTAQFMEEFATSLRKADSVYLCPIFGSARETKGNTKIESLQEKISGSRLLHENTQPLLDEKRDAVFLFMGAGDIQKYERDFLARITTVPTR